eukprot:g42096.t1
MFKRHICLTVANTLARRSTASKVPSCLLPFVALSTLACLSTNSAQRSSNTKLCQKAGILAGVRASGEYKKVKVEKGLMEADQPFRPNG